MALIITDKHGAAEQITRENLNEVIAAALKLTVIKTTPEVEHEPVSIAYAARDLGVTDATVRRMIFRGQLKTNKGGVVFQSLHDLKIKRKS